MRKSLIMLCIIGLLLIDTPARADSGVPPVRLPDDSPVPVTGSPFFIEDLTVGAPMSDMASHAGVKASVLDDRELLTESPVPGDSAINMAHYACWALPGLNRQWDQSYLYLLGEKDYPPAEREISFAPWGWRESGYLGSIGYTAEIAFVLQDALLWHVTLDNNGEDREQFSPRVKFFKDADSEPETVERVYRDDDSCRFSGKTEHRVLLDCKNTANAAPVHFLRQMALTESSGAAIEKVSADPSTGVYVVGFTELDLEPGAKASLEFLIIYGHDIGAVEDREELLGELEKKAEEALELVGEKPEEALETVRKRWDRLEEALPPIHSSREKDLRLSRLALAALEHSRYGLSEGAVQATAVPAKSFHNTFQPWVMAYQALGFSAYDTGKAKDILRFLFENQEIEYTPWAGMVYGNFFEGGAPVDSDEPVSTPPNFGWAILQTYAADGAHDVEWLQRMYDASSMYLDFWYNFRDRDIDKSDLSKPTGNGLFEYANREESGWDDSVRFGCDLAGNDNCAEYPDSMVEAVDLNSWLYTYYSAMTEMATILDLPVSEWEKWDGRATETADSIEDKLWSPNFNRYLDRIWSRRSYQFEVSDTPATVWPLFSGVTKSSDRAKLVIARLLDSNKFWRRSAKEGVERWPMPTVAYDSPHFDDAQDGYLRQGQVWIVTSYAAIQALFRYGYTAEAEELKETTLDMIAAADQGGIHDAYNGKTGQVGWGWGSLNKEDYESRGGIGQPSPFQYGWSAALVLEMLYDRYQRDRYLLETDAHVTGFIHEIAEVQSRALALRVDTGDRNQPYVELDALDPRPMKYSFDLSLKLSDPYASLTGDEIVVTWPQLNPDTDLVFAFDGEGESRLVESERDDVYQWTVKSGELHKTECYVGRRFMLIDEMLGGEDSIGGCQMVVANPVSGHDGSLLLLLLVACFITLRWMERKPGD